MRALARSVLAMAGVLVAVACSGAPAARPQTVTDGDPQQGKEAIVTYGCLACHRIPGLEGGALVGPPLDAFGQRDFIAGQLPNSQQNLVSWITDPEAVEPGTAMPNLGVSRADAVDISAYLLSLR